MHTEKAAEERASAVQEVGKHRMAAVLARCRAVVHHLMHKKMAYAYNAWHAFMADLKEKEAAQKRVHERAHELLCKAIHHNIAAAWHSWVEMLKEQHRQDMTDAAAQLYR